MFHSAKRAVRGPCSAKEPKIVNALEPDGCLDMRMGADAGLRDGNWSFCITADFSDEDAYRRYDLEDEHNRIRRELFAPICEEIVRVQFAA